MSIADDFLARLSGVRRTGSGRWVAKCPAHEDRRASMTIRELEDGRLLVHDFAGCSVEEIVGAVGMKLADLFPPRAGEAKAERAPFPAADILRAVAFETLVVSCAAATLSAGEALSQVDRDRLALAAKRLREAAEWVR